MMNLRHVALCVLLSLTGIAHVHAAATDRDPAHDLTGLWKDPEFKKQFLGTYGIHSEVEPRVSPEERDQLEKIYNLLSGDLAAATRQVTAMAKPDCNPLLDFVLGNIHFQEDRLDEAAQRFRTAIAKFPSFLRAHKNLALIQVREGDMPGAIQSLTKTIELGGTDALTYGLLGYAYSAQEDFVAAESGYRMAALLQPGNLDWKLGLARCLFRQRDFGEAVVLLDELIQERPERVEFWLLQANAYIGLKEMLKAAENYEFVARTGKATLQSLSSLGDIYVNEGLFDLAGNAYQRAIEAQPEQAAPVAARAAEVLATRGAHAQAKAMTSLINERLAGQLTEEERRRLLKIEARVAVAQGEGATAATVLEQIVALDPLDGEALLLLGQHHARAGDPQRAIFYYERAESLDAFEANAKVRHAQLLVGLAKHQEAIPLLRRAHELNPRDDIARYLDQVERIARSKR
jgi:tetratricopeptide (TPR) repeat protein